MNILNNHLRSQAQSLLTLFALGAWLCNATAPHARAQLAITEVMSDAATNCAGVWTPSHPDFWELTNYGTNSIDLTGYRFYDADRVVSWLNKNLLPSTNIAPGESIIFVKNSASVPDEAAFRAWWGDDRLPTNLQIHFYPGPGFDGQSGDGVRLWDASSNLVDEVFFDQAVLGQGITFVTDPKTGRFGVLSQLGVDGAFKAATCDDIGSPGFAPTNTVPIVITQQPRSQTVDAGSPVKFHAEATGLPRPRGYQWYHDGVPIASASVASEDIPLVVSYAGCGLAWKISPPPNDLVIASVQPEHAGQYYVVLTNGLEKVMSTVVTLTVNTNPIAPQIECPSDVWWFPPLAGQRQTNLVVSRSQTAIFDVQVRAYPPPSFSWSWSADGTNFEPVYETNRSLVLTHVNSLHAGTYQVRVQNKFGTNYAYATLKVKPKPDLRITEAMAFQCGSTSWDWWELTNTGDEPANVTGYRWDDSFPGAPGGGPTITNAVVIQPGESVILLESRTRESFLEWWGPDNLPPNLQCIVYRANGLSEDGDTIRLWNPSASDIGDFIDSVGFSTPKQGASFWFDPALCAPLFPEVACPECGKPSIDGQCGAFRAANGCDLGSPGWTRWTPPCLTAVQYEGSIARLWWKAQPGSTCRIQYATGLEVHIGRNSSGGVTLTWEGTGILQRASSMNGSWTNVPGVMSGYTTTESDAMRFFRCLAAPPGADPWTDLGTFTFPGATGMATDPELQNVPQRFYRIERISPADCNCPE